MGGTDDVIQFTKDAAARLEKLVPELQTIIIPGMGHVLMNTFDRVAPFLLTRK
jgi:hypothetical protein